MGHVGMWETLEDYVHERTRVSAADATISTCIDLGKPKEEIKKYVTHKFPEYDEQHIVSLIDGLWNLKYALSNMWLEEMKETSRAEGEAKGITKGIAKGVMQTVVKFVLDEKISVSEGAKEVGMTEEDFRKLLEEAKANAKK